MSPSAPHPQPAPPSSTAALLGLLDSWAAYDPTPNLAQALRKTPVEVLRSKVVVDGSERDLTEALSPQRHGTGLLVVLVDRLRTGQTDLGALLTCILNFCNTVPPPVLRVLPDYVAALAEFLPDLATRLGSLSLCLAPLYQLSTRYLRPYFLTPVDAELVKQSLKARDYGFAMAVMQQDKVDVDVRVAPINYLDNLTYHFAGGIIQGLHGNWDRASHFFEIVVGAPGPQFSAIQLEAYKKLLLSSLLQHGKTSPLPRYVSSHVRSAVKSVTHSTSAYGEFVTTYEGATRRNEKGRKAVLVAERYKETFERDRNWGLVQMCLRALSTRTILNLTRTYSTVPLSLIAEELDLANPTSEGSLQFAAGTVMDLVAAKQLHAVIDAPSPSSSAGPTVRFLDDPETYDGEQMVRQLDSLAYQSKSWSAYVSQLQFELESNRDFLAKALKDGRVGLDGGAGMAAGGAGTGAVFEDLEMANPGWEDDYGA